VSAKVLRSGDAAVTQYEFIARYGYPRGFTEISLDCPRKFWVYLQTEYNSLPESLYIPVSVNNEQPLQPK